MIRHISARIGARLRATPRRPRRSGDRGSTPVEFAIVASSMLILAFAVVQAGLVYYAHSLALGAATQGVNAARGYQSSAGAGASHARQFLSRAGAGLLNQQVSATRSGTQATVVVTGRAVSVLPGLTFTVTKTAHGPVERVTQP